MHAGFAGAVGGKSSCLFWTPLSSDLFDGIAVFSLSASIDSVLGMKVNLGSDYFGG